MAAITLTCVPALMCVCWRSHRKAVLPMTSPASWCYARGTMSCSVLQGSMVPTTPEELAVLAATVQAERAAYARYKQQLLVSTAALGSALTAATFAFYSKVCGGHPFLLCSQHPNHILLITDEKVARHPHVTPCVLHTVQRPVATIAVVLHPAERLRICCRTWAPAMRWAPCSAWCT